MLTHTHAHTHTHTHTYHHHVHTNTYAHSHIPPPRTHTHTHTHTHTTTSTMAPYRAAPAPPPQCLVLASPHTVLLLCHLNICSSQCKAVTACHTMLSYHSERVNQPHPTPPHTHTHTHPHPRIIQAFTRTLAHKVMSQTVAAVQNKGASVKPPHV